MLMSTDVASIMLPVSRGLMERDSRDLEANPSQNPQAQNQSASPNPVRGMKRGDPEPDAHGAAAAPLGDSVGAECKRPRMEGGGGDMSQVRAQRLHTLPLGSNRVLFLAFTYNVSYV